MSVLKYKDPVTGEWVPVSYGGGSGGGTEMELLWENPTPTSNFAAQTIEMDLSEYDKIEICFYTRTGNNNALNGGYGYISAVLGKGYGGLNSCATIGSSTNMYVNAWSRAVLITDTGIEFGIGQTCYVGGSNSGTPKTTFDENGEAVNIPYKIYGIKEAAGGGSGGGGGVDLSAVYPVGSIYLSMLKTNPATLFGFGTWERIKDKFLLSAGDTYAAGSEGGEAEHTLTVDEMPAHRHGLGFNDFGPGSGTTSLVRPTMYNYTNTDATGTLSVGGSQPHNNMPPYLAVYMWQRTA